MLGYVGVKCGPAARAPRALDICNAVNGDIEGCLCEAVAVGCGIASGSTVSARSQAVAVYLMVLGYVGARCGPAARAPRVV